MTRIFKLFLFLIQVVIMSSCMSPYDIPTAAVVSYRDLKPLERKWADRGFRIQSYKPVANLNAPQDWNTARLEVSLWLNKPGIVSLDEARGLVQELYRDYYALTAPQFLKKGIKDPRKRIEVFIGFVDPLNEPKEGTAIASIRMDGRMRTFTGVINGKEIRAGMIREDVREELADLVDEHNFNGQ